MDTYESKQLALIRIWQILKEYSDCDHPMTQDEISKKLEADYGIMIERKAIGRKIALLKDAGMDIVSLRNGCYLQERDFEDSELHLLIDAVLGSRHIAAVQSKDLIGRICALSNKYFKSRVKHIHSVNEWDKTDNQALFFNIELIDSAIENGRQIRYDYNKYGIDKKMHKSSEQYVTPYLMILHNQRYYLMAYSEYWYNMVFHRMDRITNMEVTDKRATPIREVPGYSSGINYKEISSAMPYMFADKPEMISFIADKGIIDQVIDWFGYDIRINKTEEYDKVKVTVKSSPSAMEYWALQYASRVKVISPAPLVERIKNSLTEAIKKYEE
ncbi:MAG: WYL domain-containing protein [Lachnospiraceae bacterium]|nr:WYL domain-containing protein [Lachnospiraceae bacterium]